MKLPENPVIARAKIERYLLLRRTQSDKSAFLAKGGYYLSNSDALFTALTRLGNEGEARPLGPDPKDLGFRYEVEGVLSGPSGVRLNVKTIWMTEHLSGITKFITLIPNGILRP